MSYATAKSPAAPELGELGPCLLRLCEALALERLLELPPQRRQREDARRRAAEAAHTSVASDVGELLSKTGERSIMKSDAKFKWAIYKGDDDDDSGGGSGGDDDYWAWCCVLTPCVPHFVGQESLRGL